MAMQKNLFVKLAKTCLVAAVVAGVTIPTWAGQPVVAAKSSPNAKSAQKAKRAQPKAKADAGQAACGDGKILAKCEICAKGEEGPAEGKG